MYWLELKRALLYGQPQITNDMLQPQTVRTAVREIARLLSFGWIDELTEDMLQRIQTACHKGQCPEIWEEFPYEKFVRPKRKRKKKRKNTVKEKVPTTQ